MRLSAPLVLSVAIAGGRATPPMPTGSTEAAIRAATEQWSHAFNACTQRGTIASLYGSDAMLRGTVSPTLTSTPAAVLTYFDPACTSSPKRTVELGQYLVRSHGELATSSGIPTFTTPPAGQRRVSPARFSFTFRRKGDRWLIVSHHSSLIPGGARSPRASAKTMSRFSAEQAQPDRPRPDGPVRAFHLSRICAARQLANMLATTDLPYASDALNDR